MASIELLMIILFGSGILAYLLGKLNKVLGTAMTILASGFVFVSIAYYGYMDELVVSSDLLGLVDFTSSHLTVFFAIIVSFVFFMVSFFNPYFIDKYKFPAVYSMLYLFSLLGVVGVFFASHFMWLFFFFELVVWSSLFLIPMEGRRRPAVWYYGFSAFGSFALLFAILLLQSSSG